MSGGLYYSWHGYQTRLLNNVSDTAFCNVLHGNEKAPVFSAVNILYSHDLRVAKPACYPSFMPQKADQRSSCADWAIEAFRA